MSKEPVLVLNLSDLNQKRNLMQKIQTLKGLHEVMIKPRKLTRSLNANDFYWAAINSVFTEWLRSEWGDGSITTTQGHEVLKREVLGVKERVDQDGKVWEMIPTTHDMDSEEFATFIDKCIEFLGTFCQIPVLDPALFYEQKEPKRSLARQLKGSLSMAKPAKQA